ncbi:MAG: DNA-protecting protein DprA [Erysipelotrichaceae bacterium]|nr:DNA-protecting protein DprA [Erysipelotrichaceae bacterium]MCB9500032.1 DNA-protecting protein DprA [Erysipelotrichaceae bacterium]
MQARELLLFLSHKYEGDWDKIYYAIRTKEKVQSDEVVDFAKSFKGNYITLTDENYPHFIKETTRPPFVLYYKGDIEILRGDQSKFLTVIGSRECTNYGRETISQIVKELPENIVIVSGLAKGIDGAAQRSALDSNKKTIGVLGGGIDNIYPKENADLFTQITNGGGLILSEYPESLEPKPNNFLFRNRIIASLGKAVLVGESYARSGTHATVCFALNEGRDIGCVPYHANEKSNCNQFIKDGACLIENAKDVLVMMGING